MSKAEKLFKQMQNNPRDWRIDQLETVARHFGLTGNRPSSGSSHVTFRMDGGGKVTVPDHKPVKPVYVNLLIKLIEESQRDE